MGVPTSEVGYTSAMPRREDHEIHKDMWRHWWGKKKDRERHWGTFMQQLSLWKSNTYYTFSVCVCSLSYPACNMREPYCHLWPVQLYNIFPHHLINCTIFGEKKVIEHKTCVVFFTTSVWKFLILRRIQRRVIINMHSSSCKIPVFLVRF